MGDIAVRTSAPGPPTELSRIADLIALCRTGARERGRSTIVAGIVGPPGSGKTYLAARLTCAVGRLTAPCECALLSMDGFHLSIAALQDLGLRAEKGSPRTFDVSGLVVLLDRVRQGSDQPIFAPDYDRALHEPVAARLRVDPGTDLVLIEGNYLLLDDERWSPVASRLDLTVYLDVPDAIRRDRLLARHERHGRTPQQAIEWLERVDEPNARAISATRSRADIVADAEALGRDLNALLGAADGQ